MPEPVLADTTLIIMFTGLDGSVRICIYRDTICSIAIKALRVLNGDVRESRSSINFSAVVLPISHVVTNLN